MAISEETDPVLAEASYKLLRALEWEGVAMVEFRRNPVDGKAALMEINGRYWGTTSLPLQAGVEFPVYEWRLAHGEATITAIAQQAFTQLKAASGDRAKLAGANGVRSKGSWRESAHRLRHPTCLGRSAGSSRPYPARKNPGPSCRPSMVRTSSSAARPRRRTTPGSPDRRWSPPAVGECGTAPRAVRRQGVGPRPLSDQAYACNPESRKFTPQKQKTTISNPKIWYTAARCPSHPRFIRAWMYAP